VIIYLTVERYAMARTGERFKENTRKEAPDNKKMGGRANKNKMNTQNTSTRTPYSFSSNTR
jgi:hypothetical protein